MYMDTIFPSCFLGFCIKQDEFLLPHHDYFFPFLIQQSGTTTASVFESLEQTPRAPTRKRKLGGFRLNVTLLLHYKGMRHGTSSRRRLPSPWFRR